MLLKRWEPFAEIRNMSREQDRVWPQPTSPHYLWRRPRGEDEVGSIDVFRQGEDLVVRASLPGVKPEDLEVTIAENALTITGESKTETEVKDEDFIHRELRSGSFKRVVNLPKTHLTDKVEGSYENGILTVTIPKGEDSKAKTVKVNVKK